MPSSTKWRIYVNATQGGSATAINEIEMRSSIGGSNLCSGGTATASANIGAPYAPGSAFDGNTSTYWYSGGSGAQWIQYEFGSAQDIVEFLVRAPGAGGDAISAPRDFDLQYWNGSSWVTTISREFEGFAANQVRVYSVSAPTVAQQVWRLYITATQSGNPGVSELALHATVGGSNLCTGGAYSAPNALNASYMSDQAFDSALGTLWISSGAVPQWITYQFAAAQNVLEYVIGIGAGEQARAPKSWKLQYNDGAGGWVDADSQTSVANWSNNESRTYSLAPAAVVRPVVFACT
jgi:hypothetical protein